MGQPESSGVSELMGGWAEAQEAELGSKPHPAGPLTAPSLPMTPSQGHLLRAVIVSFSTVSFNFFGPPEEIEGKRCP